jgi:hypothetical protein
MRPLVSTPALLIWALVSPAQPAAPAPDATGDPRAAQTRDGKTALTPGQYGYVPAGKGRALVTRNPKALPSHTARSQRTMHDLAKAKLPSNQPTDVAKAAQQVKDGAKAGKP